MVTRGNMSEVYIYYICIRFDVNDVNYMSRVGRGNAEILDNRDWRSHGLWSSREGKPATGRCALTY